MKYSQFAVAPFLLISSALLFGQPPNPSEADTLKLLLTEVHELRLALEKSATVVPRLQVTVQRMTVQQQTIARISQQLGDIRKQLDNQNEIRAQAESRLPQIEQRLSVSTDAVERSALEQEKSTFRKLISDQTTLPELRGRESALAASLQKEQAALTELNDKIDILERTLAPK